VTASNGKTNGGRREADRRRTILRAAVEVFSKKGFHGCRIADVAREAGVAYGLVYHYFKNKDELLNSVFESGWKGFVQRITEQVGAAKTLEERVNGVVAVAFDAYKRDPRGVKVLILEIGRSPAGGSVNRGSAFGMVIQLAAQMFQEAKDKGELSPDLDPLLSAILLFGAIEMGLTAFVLGLLDKKNDEALDRARDQVAQTFLRGILTRPKEEAWTAQKSSTASSTARRS
jgi:TetR/AcrR family transcriptional regulator, fatty acid metabolism regulator protein